MKGRRCAQWMAVRTRSKPGGFAGNMVGRSLVRWKGAPPKKQQGVCATNMGQMANVLNQSALLLAVVQLQIEKGFVENTVREGSALLKAVKLVFTVVESAASIVPNQSALGNGAPQPPNRREDVSSTAAAARKSARSKAAPLLLKRAVSAPSTVRLESASLQAASPV